MTGESGGVYNPPMNDSTTVPGKVAHGLELVSKISGGDEDAWSAFVEQFTGWVLYKSREWCVKHCQCASGSYFCGLTSLSLQIDGRRVKTDLPECDEGLDTYIWLFGQLRRRIRKYTGKNDCLLSTFVWTILNSREIYIDWLRWKYGRIF